MCLHLVLHLCQVYHYVTEDTQTAAILHQGTGDLPWSDGGSEAVINVWVFSFLLKRDDVSVRPLLG